LLKFGKLVARIEEIRNFFKVMAPVIVAARFFDYAATTNPNPCVGHF